MQSCIRPRSPKSGAAIVELALSMLLMFSLLLFVIFLSRFLSDRNRVQAASRTQAWIYAHKADYADGDTTDLTGKDMHHLFRRWFFKETGPAAGIVVLETPREGTGIFYRSEGEDTLGDLNKGITDMLTSTKNESEDVDAVETNRDTNSTDYSSAGGILLDILGMAVKGFLNFLTDDFKYYEAEVGYGMPLVFPLAFYQMFWSGTFSQPGNIENEQQATQASPNTTYVYYNPDYTQGAVFPELNASTKDALDELNSFLGGLMDLLQGFLSADKSEITLYRPHKKDGDSLLETENRLKAVLVYEYVGYDEQHRYAKKEQGSPWWR